MDGVKSFDWSMLALIAPLLLALAVDLYLERSQAAGEKLNRWLSGPGPWVVAAVFFFSVAQIAGVLAKK